jgi:hypothetical protein
MRTVGSVVVLGGAEYTSRVSFVSELDRLPAPSLTPRERLLQALQMYDEGVKLQLNNLRRRHPDLDDAALARLLDRWLRREGED